MYLFSRQFNAAEIIDVVVNHQFALITREGKWEQIESSKIKRAKESATQAAKDWEYTFDAVPDLIAVLNKEYRVVRANKAMAARLGVTPEECTGLTCYHVMHGTDEPPSYCLHMQLLQDGLEHTSEIHEDSLGGDFMVSVSPLHDSEGKLTGCVHVARDITKRKRAEEALQKSERRYHLLFENMLDGFAYCRMLYDDFGYPVDFIYLDTNNAFERLTGLKGVTGKRVTEVIPGIKEQHPELFDAYSRVALTGQPDRFEIEFKPLGIWLWVSVYSTEIEHFVAVFDNITDRKRVEGALSEAYEALKAQSKEAQAQSEEIQVQYEELQAQSEDLHEAYSLVNVSEIKFRTLAENSPDLIARFDRQNHCLYANPAAMTFYDIPDIAEFYDISVDELANRTHFEIQIDPEMLKLSEKQRANVFTTGKPEAMESHYISLQGKEYYFDLKIVPEFIDGEVASVLVISRDITTIKEAEAKLNETLGNLEDKVKERTTELEEAYNSLKESEKSLAEAQRMAHIGNWDWNLVTSKLYWSNETYRILGLNPQEFSATYDALLSYVHPDDRDHVENVIKEALNGKPYDIDYRIILADGEERIVHAQGEAIFDEKNIPVQMKGTSSGYY